MKLDAVIISTVILSTMASGCYEPKIKHSEVSTASMKGQGETPGLAQSSELNAVQRELRVLFLGDNGIHHPPERFPELAVPLAQRGIELEYTERVDDLNLRQLEKFDGLILYANIDRIEKSQEEALLEYVASGGGFVPLHSASYCFRNSPRVVALIGGQFQRHGAGIFRTEISRPPHPLMQGFGGLESWDETYVHHMHNKENRTVLSYRVDEQGREPYTWIRTHGKGRVFYTAWGHDQRTWRHPGFHNLVERGIRWAAGADLSGVPAYLEDQPFPVPKMTPRRQDLPPQEYVDVGAKIPNYTSGGPWGAEGQSFSQMQKPLIPAESMKHMVVPQGFHVELFASEQDFHGKPICMNWDERGRLWVAETTDYPNALQPPGKGHDRVRICEDTDGDGRADKFITFAENLSIPASLVFSHGGIIVQDGTQTVFLKDTNGDDVADQRRVLFSSWNMGDTHGGVSNFQYGLDHWIWAMQGYNHSQPESGGKLHQGFRQGFFRFRPDGSEIEFIRSTNNNTWGLGISEEGLIFGSTANGNPSVFMPIANRYYERVRGWTPSLTLGGIADTHRFEPITDRVRQVDWFGGYTAGAGHALYTARSYPDEYWNRTAFVCGPTGHLVGTFVLKYAGSGFRSTSPFNLLASDDEWTAPIMAEVGPDGFVWVIDWYNFIIQHNPTPKGFETGDGAAYVTELRDKTHGRIYRVVYDAASGNQRQTLAGATPIELVSALTDPNLLWRRHAQRLLVERGKTDVVGALIGLVQNDDVDTVGLNVGAIHALWTLHGLGALDSHADAASVATAAVEHPAAGVRLNALRVLPKVERSSKAVLETGVLADPDPQVRLAALLALADLPPLTEVAKELVAQLGSSSDRVATDAAIAAAARNDVPFLQSVLAIDNAKRPLIEAVEIVAEHFARGTEREAAIPLIGPLHAADTAVTSAVINGLVRGWPEGATVPLTQETEAQLEDLAQRLDPRSRGRLIKLAQVWGSDRLARYADQLIQQLLATLDDATASEEEHLLAYQQIVEMSGSEPNTVKALLHRISPQAPPHLVAGIIDSLASSTWERTGAALTDKFPSLAPDARKAAIKVLLGRQVFTDALLAGIERGVIQVTELTLDQQRVLSRHPKEQIRRRAIALLERGGSLPSPDRQIVLDQLMPITEVTGNTEQGRQIFKKNCATCHVHTGEGTRIGPDLTGMAVHPKKELLAHIIDPSRSVEGNFRLYSVLIADGQTLSGMLVAESKTSIQLVDFEGNTKNILREDIDELVASRKSAMPDGFEKQIPRDDLRDLLEFLTQRGRFVPLDLRRAATITSVKGMFYSRDAMPERLIFHDWSTKTVHDVPFELIDPHDGDVANVILLYSPRGSVSAEMPRQVKLPIHGTAKTIHMLSGVSGWGFSGGEAGSHTMTVRLVYEDNAEEDHPLYDGIHFADYIRRIDVPESEFAFGLRDQQIRYLAIHPSRPDRIRHIEFIKGADRTAPVVMAVTIEN